MPPVTFDILARDRASQTFDKIAHSTENLESRFGRLQRTARNFATGLVGAEVGKSILEAADKLELSRSRLETVTKNIGGNFEDIASQVGVADEKLAKFGYTSAETEGALATLEAVTKNPEKAFNDLGLAADIARGRNISLGESVAILSRIETGHVAMLSRLGIATKDAAGNTLTQAQALQMLSQLYGGAASKYAETFAGKQAAVRAELENSAAQIGVALLPAAVQLANVLSHDLLPPIVSTAQWLDRNRKTIEPLAKAVLIGVGAWKAYGLAVKVAGELTALVGTRATVAAGRVAAASVVEAAATKKAAAVMLPDLRAMALAEDAAAAAGRRRAIAIGAGAIGTGAVVGGQMLGGRYGNELSAAGFATMLNPRAGLVVGTGVAAYEGTSALLNRTPVGRGVDWALNHTELPNAFGIHFGPSAADSLAGPKLQELIHQYGSLDKALAALRAQNQATKVSQDALNQAMKAARVDPKNALALSSAQDSLRQAMHQAAQAAADNGRALRGNSDAALGNRDAVRQQVTAALGVVDAMKAQGRSAHAQASMLDVLTQAVETNAIKTYGDKSAVDALLTSLGLIPGQAQAAASALDTYAAAQVAADRGIDPRRLAGLQAQDDKTQAKAKASAKKILDSFTSDFSPVVSKASEEAAKKADSAAKKAADKAKQRFNDLRQSMLNDLASIRDAVRSTTESLAGFGAVTNGLQGTDSLGAAMTGNVFTSRKQEAARIKQFAAAYERLARMGLNADDLHQFIQAGPDALPAMQQIIATKGGVRTENTLQRQIQSTAGRLSREDAASQNASLIHSDMLKLPRRLALELAGELRKMHIITDANGLDHRNGVIVAGAG